MSEVVVPLVLHGTYVKAGGSALKFPTGSATFFDRVSVLYLLPDEHFGFFTYRRGYEMTIAAGQWVRSGKRVVLQGLADHESDCTRANFYQRSFTRRFLVDQGAAGPTLLDDSPPPWEVLGWSGPFTFLGPRQCVTSVNWELALCLRWPERWDDLSPWVTAFLSRTPLPPLSSGAHNAGRG
jgi:hypothetical protein